METPAIAGTGREHEMADVCTDAEARAVQWIEEHHARIYAFLRRRAGSDADAADLTQRTFTKAWQSAGRFEGRSSVASWLHGIAHHVLLDWQRARRRFEERAEAWWEQLPAAGPSPLESTEARDAASELYGAVDRLEAGLRDTVHLHYYQGLSIEETADALGVSPSTVKCRAREAIAQLRHAMNPENQHQNLPATRRI